MTYVGNALGPLAQRFGFLHLPIPLRYLRLAFGELGVGRDVSGERGNDG
jgi:hypothetical protein